MVLVLHHAKGRYRKTQLPKDLLNGGYVSHTAIQQNKVGLKLVCHVQCLHAVVGLTYNLHVTLGVDQLGKLAAALSVLFDYLHRYAAVQQPLSCEDTPDWRIDCLRQLLTLF